MYNLRMISLVLTMLSAALPDDEEVMLIKRAQKGEETALEALILKYEKKVYNVAYRFMGNEADAYDMAQEAFIKIYKGLKSFRLEASFSSWVYRVSVNTSLDGLRKRKKAPLYLDNHLENGSVFEDKANITPEAYVLSIESKEDIQKAINLLSEDHKATIILRDVQGLSYEEIAETLSISIGTVKSRLNRGRARLKEILIEK